MQEPNGGKGILIQWPTIIHATAYVVDLYEETSTHRQSMLEVNDCLFF